MNKTTVDAPKSKKSIIMSAIACLPLAVMLIAYSAFLFIEFVRLVSAPHIDAYYVPLVLLVAFLKPMLLFFYIVLALAFCAIAAVYIYSFVMLIKRHDDKIPHTVLSISFAISVIICVFSIYPFIINLCRIIVHGFEAQFYFGFFILGAIPLTLSVLCIIFNRIAVRKQKQL